MNAPALGILGLIAVFVVGGLYVHMSEGSKSALVHIEDTFTDVQIQPKEAVAIAQPYFAEHGTTQLQEDEPLTIVIVRKGDWYGVMETNYPAKTFEYYYEHGVQVHVDSGEVTFDKT